MLDSLKNIVANMSSSEPAHDFDHIMRVYKNAIKICKKEKADKRLVLCAVLLHDIVSYPKSEHTKNSAADSAKKAKDILKKYPLTDKEITIITDAIANHSFSQNKVPATLEGKILQDADRLDAIGAIGIARVFATAGSLQRLLYNTDDPFCKTRTPDDSIWTLDHFFQKLLKLESLMHTDVAKKEAKKRTIILKEYLRQLGKEI